MTGSSELKNTLSLDCAVDIYKEKIKNKGEDCRYYHLGEKSSVFGVFDGCGGSGSEVYDTLDGRTGAYIASRSAEIALKSYLNNDEDKSFAGLAESLKAVLIRQFSGYAREGAHKRRIKSRMQKSFPTTCALCVVKPGAGELEILCVWAGDSRCYILGASGLIQLTEDDIGDIDPMENLKADAKMTNVVNISGDYVLHSRFFKVNSPCVVFAASDGCYDYLGSPMEFEQLLIDTLMISESPADWEKNIALSLDTAGDDVSLCGGIYGYGSFEKLKKAMMLRRKSLVRNFTQGIEEKSFEEKTSIWQEYKKSYFLPEGSYRQWDTDKKPLDWKSCPDCGYVMALDTLYCPACGKLQTERNKKAEISPHPAPPAMCRAPEAERKEKRSPHPVGAALCRAPEAMREEKEPFEAETKTSDCEGGGAFSPPDDMG